MTESLRACNFTKIGFHNGYFLRLVSLHQNSYCVNLLVSTPQNDKMIKHTQKIRRLEPTNCFSLSDYFVGLALKELKHR